MTSLRTRTVIPLIAAAILAAIGVALVSQRIGARIALDEMHGRFRSIQSTVDNASFPLTEAVLRSLSRLTETEWMTLDAKGRLISSTLTAPPVARLGELNSQQLDQSSPPVISLKDSDGRTRQYLGYRFQRTGTVESPLGVESIIVLFDETRISARARRAAVYPLLTGLSTVAVTTLVLLAISSRLIHRIGRLEAQVQRIAAGDFATDDLDTGSDEIGRLAASVQAMSGQLKKLWSQVNRQQSAKLLHQISGGMAHQLRNTLTGAKLALQLHRDRLAGTSHDEVDVALRQMQIAEDYVARLLALGNNKKSTVIARGLGDCLREVRQIHTPVAKHSGVSVNWQLDPKIDEHEVADGESFCGAVSNLLLNAIDSGDEVFVTVETVDNECKLVVSDNGPGIAPEIADELFEPFITSKPEGMGLGLPLVARAAAALDGEIDWCRNHEHTEFRLTVKTSRSLAGASQQGLQNQSS